MDAKLKADWITALRSGEYKQGFERFESGDRFCCLGVLCVSANQPAQIDGCSNWKFVEKQINEETRRYLYDLNDQGTSFNEIADYIEANIPAEG